MSDENTTITQRPERSTTPSISSMTEHKIEPIIDAGSLELPQDTIPGLISVIIPTHNRAESLPRSINSVLEQSYENLEIVVIDDGSIDDTAEIMTRYADDRRVRYFRQNHCGASAARNFGITLARGEFIAFQDSDDEWLPDKLQKQLAYLRAPGSNIEIVYSDMIRVLRNGKTVYHASPDAIHGQLFDPETLDYQCANIGLQSIMGHAHCFREIGGFDNNLMAYIDLDLFIRLSKRYTFAHMKEPSVKYYETDGIQSNFSYKFEARKYLLNKYKNEIGNNSFISKQYLLLAITLQHSGKYRDSLHYVFRALHADGPSVRCVMHATYLTSGVHILRVKIAKFVRSIL